MADLLERLAQGLERGSRHWTAARKKDSLQRVLGGSRSDPRRLRERAAPPAGRVGAETDEPGSIRAPVRLDDQAVAAAPPSAPTQAPAAPGEPPVRDWNTLVQSLEGTLRAALPRRRSARRRTGRRT